ncbi:hypothetical protein ACFFMR_29075 [Micromonospora andamanensis]|uniref:XRE family transcriptional regulator n=1 Tax=Micromonospora andamanensis TaxID=1287068 RepID=A0ABQ4I3X2_9ACTN|nr:hypothetical protein [Micromonospora andamanensis]GIJ12610.1 hypothetical protein Van01_58240 [Micromonospora andamanensis]
MSRQEVAEAVSAWIWEHLRRRTYLDSRYIGKLERGESRWPVSHVRAGLRGVFGVDNDASIGLHVIYGSGRPTEAVGDVPAPAWEREPEPTPLTSRNDRADVTPTVHLGVAAGTAVVVTVDSGPAGPVRVVLTAMPEDCSERPALPLAASGGARVYSLAYRRRQA